MIESIKKALLILGIDPPITLKELKKRYREKAKTATEEELKEISKAYRLLTEFIENYPFRFSEEEIIKSFPEERLKNRFRDPLWGGR